MGKSIKLNATEFVTGLYLSILNRNPEPEGLNLWVKQLEDGKYQPNDLINRFLKSDEYLSREFTKQFKLYLSLRQNFINSRKLAVANTKLTREAVIGYYEYFLGHSPESESDIQDKINNFSDDLQLIKELIKNDRFLSSNCYKIAERLQNEFEITNLTRDDVIWGFRYCFGRDPESESVIQSNLNFKNWKEFRENLFKSQEFQTIIFKYPHSKWVMTEVMQGSRFQWIDLSDSYVSRGCLYDNYESAETEFVRKHLKSNDIFLDIGANIGWFTLLASTIIKDNGRICSFEPRPQTCFYLRKTIDANKLNNLVTIYKCGLSNKNETASLIWRKDTDNPGGSFVSDRLLPSDHVSQSIKLQTLDSLGIEHADFIKIDIEGSEYKAFQGAQKLLQNSRPIILSEINPLQLKNVSDISPNEYINFFISLGYRIEIVGGTRNGEFITEYPSDYLNKLINVGMIPSNRL